MNRSTEENATEMASKKVKVTLTGREEKRKGTVKMTLKIEGV